MSKEKKENLVGKISDKEIENVSGGEIQGYRNLGTLFRKRYRVTDDRTGEILKSGIKSFDEADDLNKKLNSETSDLKPDDLIIDDLNGEF